MSSISIDASGARALSMTVNDPSVTRAQIPTKNDDDLTVYVGNAGEVSVVVPIEHAKVKIVRDKNGREIAFVKMNFLNATAYSLKRVSDDPNMVGSPAHATVSARRDVQDMYADAEVVREATFAELLGVTTEG